ncbi:MAG: aspartyl protease family protein [Acidobacteria bacterium]|nr:aspartyl protease family protein [Acidobacteriota bacterium]
MRVGLRGVVIALAVAAAAPIVIDANSTPASARSEIRLELGDLLFGDERYWEAIVAFERAKEGARSDQVARASRGLLRSLLQVAEFARARQEAEVLAGVADPADAASRTLYADALWASGLFAEAEAAYRDALAIDPEAGGARHGLARGLAARGRLEEGLAEAQAAVAAADTPEAHHTLSTIYRRLRRFPEAAEALTAYVDRLPGTRRTEKAQWARSEVRFLRSFGDRPALDIPPEQAVRMHTIPFRLERDKVVVRGRINGGPDMDLVIDTGAEQMVLSKPTAERHRIRPIVNTLSAGVGDIGLRGLEMGRADSLEIGTLTIRNIPAIIKNPPLSGLPDTRVENSISPLAFGMSAIIDYEREQMLVGREIPEEPADVVLPLRFNRLAMVRGVVNQDHPKSFIVDTGGEVISISLATANTLGMVPVRHIPLQVFGTSGWDMDAFLLPGVHLAFDRIQYENFSVVVLNLHRPSALLGFHIGGIVGHRFLSNYRVTLDLQRSTLRLTRI